MRGMPINLQGKGVLEVAAATETLWRSAAGHIPTNSGNKTSIGKEGLEPRSVLDHRSPSPPTSTSTLSSSLGGGGGGSIDTASVAAVSDNPLHKWPPSQDTTSSGAAEDAVGGGGSNGTGAGRKEEWASELQPIPAGLEIGIMGGDKCGLGMEDWETVLSEPAAVAASPGHDQTFLRWIMGDADDTSSLGLKHQNHQQLLAHASLEFEGGAAGGGGFGVVDPVFGFEPTFGIGGGGSSSVVAPPLACSSAVASAGGFPVVNNNGSTNSGNRILPIPPSAGPLPGIKAPSFGNNSNPSLVFSSSPANSLPLPLSLPPGMLFQEPTGEEKAHLFGPNILLNQQQVQPPPNPAFFLPLSPYTQSDHHQQHILLPAHPKRHHSMVDPSCQVPPRIPVSNSGQDLFLRRHQQPQQQQQQQPQGFESLHVLSSPSPQPRPMKPKLPGDEATAAAAQQQQALVDQLFKAAELVEAGNFVNAHGILARLNHHLSPIGKPLIRSAFYCKEALQCMITNHSSTTSLSPSPPLQRNLSPTALSSPLDVVLKLSAYKAFSDTSPILQFANFTCTQALLEELDGFDRIHVIDFDIGVGGHWSSFMQELAQRRCAATATSPSLRITAFVSLSSHHPFELGLTRENLSHFANELNIPFDFNILSMDSFDPAGLLGMSQSGEAIAVNLPAGSAHPSIPTLLRLVKQLAPKIVVSVDHGCDHSDFTFSRHFLHVLQSTAVLLDSIDASGCNPEAANKIERYLLQPRIENSVLGRHRAADKALPWWTLFASAGFVSVSFSNFTETQAECLLKRLHVRGFHVEKRQASLLLCWQRVGLVSVSAWRC